MNDIINIWLKKIVNKVMNTVIIINQYWYYQLSKEPGQLVSLTSLQNSRSKNVELFTIFSDIFQEKVIFALWGSFRKELNVHTAK